MKCCRMLAPLCVLLLIASALSVPLRNPDLDSDFEEWKTKHKKVYSGPEEEAERRSLWEETRKRVEAHNKEADQGLHTYWMGMNQFSDQTKEERQRGCVLPPLINLDQEIEQPTNVTHHVEHAAGNSTDVVPLGAQGDEITKEERQRSWKTVHGLAQRLHQLMDKLTAKESTAGNSTNVAGVVGKNSTVVLLEAL